MSIVQVIVIPVGTDGTSLSHHVVSVLNPLKKSGLKYELTSMGTNIEGPLDEILKVAREMHERPFAAGIKRVLTTLVIDDRRDKELSIEGKKRAAGEER
jgi:uncharacterized protein (TIGR00106 family)